jgi:hypothetical protein
MGKFWDSPQPCPRRSNTGCAPSKELIGATDIVTDIAKLHAFSQLFELVELQVLPRNRADVRFVPRDLKNLYRVFRSQILYPLSYRRTLS